WNQAGDLLANVWRQEPRSRDKVSSLWNDALIALSARQIGAIVVTKNVGDFALLRSEEHTSELQSLTNLVCRLLLEKKKAMRHKRRMTKPRNMGQELSMTTAVDYSRSVELRTVTNQACQSAAWTLVQTAARTSFLLL